MLDALQKDRLRSDFVGWGAGYLSRAIGYSKKYGVLCSSTHFARDGKG